MLYSGLTDGTKISQSQVAYIQPFSDKIGTFGFSWQQLNTQKLYTEQTIALGYGRRITNQISFGMNLKHLLMHFALPDGVTNNLGDTSSQTDPVFKEGNSESNISVDMGGLWKFADKYAFGMMVQDVNEPDMALSNGGNGKIPKTIRSGVSYQNRTLTLMGQLNWSKSASSQDQELFYIVGGEKWWFSKRFTRADWGLRGSLMSGSNSFNQWGMELVLGMEFIDLELYMEFRVVNIYGSFLEQPPFWESIL